MVLRTTRLWLPRDLEVLKPVFERMRTEGPDFLQKNSALAEEIRRTFVDLDEVEKELKKAAKAINTAAGLTTKYRGRLQELCDNAPCRPAISVALTKRLARSLRRDKHSGGNVWMPVTACERRAFSDSAVAIPVALAPVVRVPAPRPSALLDGSVRLRRA